MIKKSILIILLLMTNPITTANAGFWDAVGACFTDPCNCGDSDKTRREYWDNRVSQPYRSVDRDSLCPPWNKESGRDDHTCLIKAGYPGSWIGYYENLCGEETPDSIYMNPKIRVRGQQCNALACWTTDNTLNWDGQCVTLASGYGIPLLRMCARVAIPAGLSPNFPEDPGYTAGVHLDFEGKTVPDDIVIGYDGLPVTLSPPKLCLYKDPAFLSFKDGFDLMDLDPNKQSSHKTATLHPVIKVLLFFLDMAVQVAQTPGQLLGALVDMLFGKGDDGQTTFSSVMKDLLGYVGWLIETIGNAIGSILKAIGQINRAVDSTVYGCVNIPMGPYPPPFCPTVQSPFQTAYIQKICSRDSGGNLLPSLRNEPCVVSALENNFVRNSLRITYENFVPLCPNNVTTDINNDKCAVIEHSGTFPTASDLHAATAKTDILPKCSGGNTPCVRTALPVPNTCVGTNCNKIGFRIVYGLRMGSTSSPQSYFMSDLADCPSSASSCQEIWGINTSELADVSVTFPRIQTSSDMSSVVSDTVTLKDKNGRSASYTASISRVSAFDPVFKFAQNPKQICVRGGNILIGCENRAPIIKPEVYDCTSPANVDIPCTSTYYTPTFVAKAVSGTDSTSAIVQPKTVYNPTNLQSSVNLAGYNFDSFVTDTTLATTPFSGSHSPNPGSLYGTYLNNIFPVNSNGSVNRNAIYLYGLEYINNQYYVGGKRACLKNRDLDKCPKNETLCVLTNLVNRDTVNCENFIAKLSAYPGMIRCGTTPQVTGCTNNVDNSLGNGVSIYLCGSGAYCYTSPINADLCQISNRSSDRHLPEPSLEETLADSQYYHFDSDVTDSGAYSVNCTPVNDVVNCQNFLTKLASYPGTARCTTEQTSRCTSIVDSVPAISGGTGVTIRSCNSGIYCYTSPTGADLCQTINCSSTTDTAFSGYNYDKSKYAIRDKTSYEMSLCTDIPQPKCPATSNYSSQEDGYAAWPETTVGEMATGSCATGWIEVAPLQRWCVPSVTDPDKDPSGTNRTFIFSRLYTKDSSGNRVYSNVKCKAYQINLLSRTDTFPANYTRSTTSNSSNYSGNVTLGLYDYTGTNVISAGTYTSTLTFNVPDSVSNIDYFKITSMANDDFALVKVNNTAVYSSPSTSQNCGNGNISIGNFTALSYNSNGTATLTKSTGGTVNLGDTCTWNRSSNIDLKPYLVQGNNTITITLVVIGGGGMHYSIDYKMKTP